MDMEEKIKYINVGLDIDGVLADFDSAWRKLYNDCNPKTTWYLDDKIGERLLMMESNNTLDDFYLSLKPLINPKDIPFIPKCYITSRPVSSEITTKWLAIHGFPDRPVFTVRIHASKYDIAVKYGIKLFIDDAMHNFNELNEKGIDCLLYTAPHNLNENVGDQRLDTLKDINKIKNKLNIGKKIGIV